MLRMRPRERCGGEAIPRAVTTMRRKNKDRVTEYAHVEDKGFTCSEEVDFDSQISLNQSPGEQGGDRRSIGHVEGEAWREAAHLGRSGGHGMTRAR